MSLIGDKNMCIVLKTRTYVSFTGVISKFEFLDLEGKFWDQKT